MGTFKVEYWDEFYERTKFVSGYAAGSTYSEIMNQISNWFGEEQINRVEIAMWEDSDCGILITDQTTLGWEFIDTPKIDNFKEDNNEPA